MKKVLFVPENLFKNNSYRKNIVYEIVEAEKVI